MPYAVHATKKLLDKLRPASLTPLDEAAVLTTTALGPWYATAIFWRPQVALFVNQQTLMPVFMPLAPAATLLTRFPGAMAVVLREHGVDEAFISSETEQMVDALPAKTASRSHTGIMNEFTLMAESGFGRGSDLVELSVVMARTPCGPLYKTHVSPDRALAALLT